MYTNKRRATRINISHHIYTHIYIYIQEERYRIKLFLEFSILCGMRQLSIN